MKTRNENAAIEERIFNLYEKTLLNPLKDVITKLDNIDFENPKWKPLIDTVKKQNADPTGQNLQLMDLENLRDQHPEWYKIVINDLLGGNFDLRKIIETKLVDLEKLGQNLEAGPDKEKNLLQQEILKLNIKLLEAESQLLKTYISKDKKFKKTFNPLAPDQILKVIDNATNHEELKAMSSILQKEYVKLTNAISNTLLIEPTKMHEFTNLEKEMGTNISKDKEFKTFVQQAKQLESDAVQGFNENAEKLVTSYLKKNKGYQYKSEVVREMGFNPLVMDLARAVLISEKTSVGKDALKKLQEIEKRAKEYNEAEQNSPLKNDVKRKTEATNWNNLAKTFGDDFSCDKVQSLNVKFDQLGKGTKLLLDDQYRQMCIVGENNKRMEGLSRLFQDVYKGTVNIVDLTDRGQTAKRGRTDGRERIRIHHQQAENEGLNATGLFSHRPAEGHPSPQRGPDSQRDIRNLESKEGTLPPLPPTPGRKGS